MSVKRLPHTKKSKSEQAPSRLDRWREVIDGWVKFIEEVTGLTRSLQQVLLAGCITIPTATILHSPTHLTVEALRPVTFEVDTLRDNPEPTQDHPAPAGYPLRVVTGAWALEGNRFAVSIVDATQSEVWNGFAFRVPAKEVTYPDTIEAEIPPISKSGVYFFRLYSTDLKLFKKEIVMDVESAKSNSPIERFLHWLRLTKPD